MKYILEEEMEEIREASERQKMFEYKYNAIIKEL